MGFRRTANAIVSRPGVEFDEWMETLRGQNEGAVPRDHVHRVAKTVLRKCDPKQYLLSHATIVASVDTYAPKNAKIGRNMVQGVQIDVRWPDFRIKPECHDIINNNSDAWERSLLLSTYRTFIGAHNYLEHIQLPALSKGFIVDAIARDLGKSAYIDILVATDRKHQQLVTDIVAGDISAMSMGCHLPGTQVYLSDGSPIGIEDVRPNMEVLTQKGNSCRVENLQIRENRWKVRTIKSVGLPPITSTDNHNYYIIRCETVEKTRGRGGKNSKLHVVEKDYPFDYAEARTIREGDFLAFPISQDEVQSDVTLSEARLLGLWIGDGWKFENNHDSTVGVGFCLDESHPEIVREAIQALDQVAWVNRELHVAMGGNAPRPQSTSVSNRRGASYLMNTSRSFRAIVDRHTSGRTSSDKLIGKSVMSWPKDHQMAFLSGLIDSDGCVSTSKRGTKNVFLSTRNLKLAHQYMQIAARCGIIPTFSVAERSGTKMLPEAAGIDYQIKLRNSDVVRVPSLKVRSAIGGIRSTKAGRNNRWITDKYIYSEVKKIDRSDYAGFVYDLQVDQDHSYVANGVGVSNCISLFTVCTRCGNVASDDAQLCPCVLYLGKGTKFADEQGIEHPVAELIGHASVPNSNQFIEASWVRNPAFRGAVRRNILNPDSTQVASNIDEARKIYSLRSEKPLPKGMKKAASRIAQGEDQDDQDLDSLFDQGEGQDQGGGQDQDQGADQGGGQDSGQPKPDKLDEMLDKVQEQLLSILVDKLGEKLEPKPEDVGSIVAPSLERGNDNIVRSSNEFDRRVRKTFPKSPNIHKWASKHYRIVHEGGSKAVRASKMTSKDLIVLSWIEDRVRGHSYSPNLYKTAMKTGSISNFPSKTSFLASCKMKLGRDLSVGEEKFLIWKGRIASASNF